MDLSKLTKAELIERLEQFSHMPTTIRHKDKVISGLNQEIKDLQTRMQKENSEEVELLMKQNKELVDENREVFSDIRYLLQVLDVFVSNFGNNTQLVKILLKKYLIEGDKK